MSLTDPTALPGLQADADLSGSNTLGLPGRAELLLRVTDEDSLAQALAFAAGQGLAVTILGGGSNVVLAGDVPGLVLQMALSGVRVLQSPDDFGPGEVLVEAAAGENWHAFTQRTLVMGLGGLENLSLIPGTVGAAPVQNIGAYGVELADVMHALTAYDRVTRQYVDIAAADCAFGYRESRFKSAEPGRHVIVRVRFRLSRQPALRIGYGDIRQALAAAGADTAPTAQDVATAVIAIRRSKLPDPAELGNAGSFFKNPVVPVEQADELRLRFPGVVSYPQPGGLTAKLAAGWLIEQAGWKGCRLGAVGVHDRQALVLVHHGGGSGAELLALADAVRQSVRERFGVLLEQEPVILGGVR